MYVDFFLEKIVLRLFKFKVVSSDGCDEHNLQCFLMLKGYVLFIYFFEGLFSLNTLDFRDEISVQYSPMSEDSDDSRYYESSTNTCSSQPESAPTSPVSPYRCPKPLTGFVSGPPPTSYPSHVSSSASPQPRQRGSDTEGRFPSSPSDICHSADLRRAALLRSVQMRAKPLEASQFEPGNSIEADERPCSYMKIDVDERGCHIGECSMSQREKREKSCRTLAMNLKGDESADE